LLFFIVSLLGVIYIKLGLAGGFYAAIQHPRSENAPLFPDRRRIERAVVYHSESGQAYGQGCSRFK
jgi:hypothetical protein